MSEQEEQLDARGAAFKARPKAFKYLEWEGHTYEVRPSTLSFQRKLRDSKEDEVGKAVDSIIACTFWPPNTHDAGKPMFSLRDKDAIMSSYGDAGSLWVAILHTIGEQKKAATSPKAVEEEVGNSGASPGA